MSEESGSALEWMRKKIAPVITPQRSDSAWKKTAKFGGVLVGGPIIASTLVGGLAYDKIMHLPHVLQSAESGIQQMKRASTPSWSELWSGPYHGAEPPHFPSLDFASKRASGFPNPGDLMIHHSPWAMGAPGTFGATPATTSLQQQLKFPELGSSLIQKRNMGIDPAREGMRSGMSTFGSAGLGHFQLTRPDLGMAGISAGTAARLSQPLTLHQPDFGSSIMHGPTGFSMSQNLHL